LKKKKITVKGVIGAEKLENLLAFLDSNSRDESFGIEAPSNKKSVHIYIFKKYY
jgi:hypothetical protein